MKKTNAVRELEQHKIKYSLREYKVDENDLSAIHVALETGLDLERIFKTLTLLNEKNELIVACVPGGDNIDLKKLAKMANCKKVEMLPLKDLTAYTGYVRGGCSPIGIKKKHTSFIHESALKYETIIFSGGMRGLQIEMAPKDLIDYLKMTVGDIIV
ncbi:Cys-tRNA(Pro) deacylase [Fusobacterium perfoetens]|uniref:Cys-tRNA(Pro) deacylase n=1 Tax=Fusobacterium TaxID=848 RepID=UPI00147731E7|nr:Cys-tRNA(Pro) deacylase [Fusobacterium perfoetens]NME35402.1 Cys-tRNA(Pro) deacylase [Fusobacterium sp. FSA-380-WT-3A]